MKKGQTLVELAVVFPLFLLTMTVLYQMLFLVHKKIRLNQSAAKILYQAAAEKQPAGRGKAGLRKEALPSWRAYPGFGTLHAPGTLLSVQTAYRLSERSLLHWVVPGGTLHARAEAPMEPAIPGESS